MPPLHCSIAQARFLESVASLLSFVSANAIEKNVKNRNMKSLDIILPFLTCFSIEFLGKALVAWYYMIQVLLHHRLRVECGFYSPCQNSGLNGGFYEILYLLEDLVVLVWNLGVTFALFAGCFAFVVQEKRGLMHLCLFYCSLAQGLLLARQRLNHHLFLQSLKR